MMMTILVVGGMLAFVVWIFATMVRAERGQPQHFIRPCDPADMTPEAMWEEREPSRLLEPPPNQ